MEKRGGSLETKVSKLRLYLDKNRRKKEMEKAMTSAWILKTREARRDAKEIGTCKYLYAYSTSQNPLE